MLADQTVVITASWTANSQVLISRVKPHLDFKIDPLISPENWTFTFGEPTTTTNNFYFALSKIMLFKGLVERRSPGDPLFPS